MKDIQEIVELVRDDLNENTTAILDYEDLKSLIKLYNEYRKLKEKCTEYEKQLDYVEKNYISKDNIKREIEENQIEILKTLLEE